MIGLMIIMVLIALYEVPRLLRNRQHRTLVVFAFLWLLAAVYGSLLLSDIPVPKPTELIFSFFSRLGEWLWPGSSSP